MAGAGRRPRRRRVGAVSEDPGTRTALARPPVFLICALAGLVGAGAFGASVVASPRPWMHPALLLLLCAGATVVQIIPLRLSHEGQREGLHFEECFLVAMAIYLTLPETLAAMAAAVIVGHLWQRRGWMKASFNAGQLVASAAV